MKPNRHTNSSNKLTPLLLYRVDKIVNKYQFDESYVLFRSITENGAAPPSPGVSPLIDIFIKTGYIKNALTWSHCCLIVYASYLQFQYICLISTSFRGRFGCIKHPRSRLLILIFQNSDCVSSALITGRP